MLAEWAGHWLQYIMQSRNLKYIVDVFSLCNSKRGCAVAIKRISGIHCGRKTKRQPVYCPVSGILTLARLCCSAQGTTVEASAFEARLQARAPTLRPIGPAPLLWGRSALARVLLRDLRAPGLPRQALAENALARHCLMT